MIRGISCNQTRQKMFFWKLYSESTHHTVHQSTQYHMVTRFKAWENVTMGSGGIKFSSVRNHFFYFRHCGPPVFPQPPWTLFPARTSWTEVGGNRSQPNNTYYTNGFEGTAHSFSMASAGSGLTLCQRYAFSEFTCIGCWSETDMRWHLSWETDSTLRPFFLNEDFLIIFLRK